MLSPRRKKVVEENRKGGRISRRELDNLVSASCTGEWRDETTTLGHIATNARLSNEMPLSLQRKSTKTNNNRKQKKNDSGTRNRVESP